MKRALGVLVLAASVQAAQAADCPIAAEFTQANLLGVWQAQVEGAQPVSITLEKHPEFAETVRGFLERGATRIAVAGDLDDGELTLEESTDGVHISAAWLGDVVEGSCGREIRGTWRAEGTGTDRPFVMKKP
jgi:hypothetical protein